MKTWLLGLAALALGLTAVLSDGAAAAGDPTPTPNEVMRKLYGRNGINRALPKDLQATQIDWEKVQKETKEYSELAVALGKNSPPKGDKASWEKLTKAYADNAKQLHTDAEKKDKDAALADRTKLAQSCTACHRAHRGR